MAIPIAAMHFACPPRLGAKFMPRVKGPLELTIFKKVWVMFLTKYSFHHSLSGSEPTKIIPTRDTQYQLLAMLFPLIL